MRESGEPMECGIFDFYEVFSRAFGEDEEEDGVGWGGGKLEWEVGDVVTTLDFVAAQIRGISRVHEASS